MKANLSLHGHTIEISSSGTGSIDPWSLDYAHSIDLSLMCTADMAEFMLIDGTHIYKFRSFNDGAELHEYIKCEVFDTWEEFEREWLNPKIEKRHIFYEGTLEDSIKVLKASKKRSLVWKSIPKEKQREVYEQLKKLSKEKREEWYEEKFKEYGIEDIS